MDFFFYYQLSKLHQSEAKTLKFYKPRELFDIILLLCYLGCLFHGQNNTIV